VAVGAHAYSENPAAINALSGNSAAARNSAITLADEKKLIKQLFSMS
jgi:hypothetical protein